MQQLFQTTQYYYVRKRIEAGNLYRILSQNLYRIPGNVLRFPWNSVIERQLQNSMELYLDMIPKNFPAQKLNCTYIATPRIITDTEYHSILFRGLFRVFCDVTSGFHICFRSRVLSVQNSMEIYLECYGNLSRIPQKSIQNTMEIWTKSEFIKWL